MIPLRTQIPYNPRHTKQVLSAEREEIDKLLRQTLSDYDATNEEIQKLSIDCISNLTTSKALSRELSEQGYLKRTLFDFIGRNQKLQQAVNQSYSHSMYATQQLLILLMEQNKFAMEFSLHLDQKQHIINLDFSEQLSQQCQQIQSICRILQRHDLEMDEVVFQCIGCRTQIQRSSVICPHCGKIRTKIIDLPNTIPARDAYQANLDALSKSISNTPLTIDDPIQSVYDFTRLCKLPDHLQEQLDEIYVDTIHRIDTLKNSQSSPLQCSQQDTPHQLIICRTKFIQNIQHLVHNEKALIDDELNRLDHLDDQVKQLEYAIRNLKKQCGGV